MGERMMVEIVAFGAPDFRNDPPDTVGLAFAAPGSLTEARLRLADAAEAWWMANEADHSREWATLLGALAALRTKRAGE